jgi:tetratricopeptide (TPR) repeat protein
MPTTINGIGTTYYGKRNLTVRDGVCRNCGKAGRLSSYETRLWFVVVFIPVIPLQRKRILDYCPSCRRHYSVGVQQWETQRQLNVSAAKDAFRTQPSPESALAAHAAMLSFHSYDEAQQFRSEALQQFPTSATLHVGLASHLDQTGQWTQASPLYERAIELSPDLPEARVGLALRRINEGRHEEARRLLDHLMQPGALRAFAVGPLDTLMTSLQKAGRHEEALEIARHVLSELPHVGQQHVFRKFVQKSEKAVGTPDSILPESRFSFRELFDRRSTRYPKGARWAAGLGVCLILIASGLAIQNAYRQRHRRLEVISLFNKPVRVALDEAPPVEIRGTGSLPVAEGVHKVKITGPVEEEFPIDVHSGYFERWTSSPRWILNPGAAAAFEQATVHYAVANARPPAVKLIVGERWVEIPHVDYFLESPPAQLQLDSKSQDVSKQVFTLVHEAPDAIFRRAVEEKNPLNAFSFAEGQLLLNPNDADLASDYCGASVHFKQVDRVQAFLKKRIVERPVSIHLHRAYQTCASFAHQDKELQAEYAAFLAKEPNNAALMYLLGRATPDRKTQHELFDKATRTDPQLGWPWYALAYDAATSGDWPACLTLLSHIPHPEQLATQGGELLKLARFATGHAELVATAAQDKLARTSGIQSLTDLIDLVDALAVQGKNDEAKNALSQWEKRLPPATRSDPNLVLVRCAVWYYLGDFTAIKNAYKNPALDPMSKLHALMVTGEHDPLFKQPTLAQSIAEGVDPSLAMSISLAYDLVGNAAEEQSWRDKAAATFDRANAESRRAAVLLRAKEPPQFEEVKALAMHPPTKCLFVTLLAVRFPQQKELRQLARALNVSRAPDYYLVEKALK